MRSCSPVVAPRRTTSRSRVAPGRSAPPGRRRRGDLRDRAQGRARGGRSASGPRGSGSPTVGVDRGGVVDLDQLDAALDDRTAVVSVMLVNNEVGTIQPLRRGRGPGARPGAARAPPHRRGPGGAVARRGRGRRPASTSSRSRATSSAGPKGVGVLVVRDGVTLEPEIEGGGQERGLRAGHGQRRRRGRAGHRAADHPRAPDGGRRAGARPARPAGARARRRRCRPSSSTATPTRKVAGSCHVGVPGRRGRGAAPEPRRGRACTRPRGRRARRARPSRRTCSRRWVSRVPTRSRRSGSASGTRRRTRMSPPRSTSCPRAVAQLRSVAAA